MPATKRELYKLIGGPPPILFSRPPLKKPGAVRTRAAQWEYRPFKNEARADDLQLQHWARREDEIDEPYRFAVCNAKADVVDYTDEEYEKHLQDKDWSKEETDYLFELCRKYDCRFVVIADRFEFPGKKRSMEDMKDRYFSVNRKLAQARSTLPGQTSNSIPDAIMFDKTRETERKRLLTGLWDRPATDVKEEEYLVDQYKRLARSDERFQRERDFVLKTMSFQEIATPQQQLPLQPKRKRSSLNVAIVPPDAAQVYTPIESPNKKLRRASSSSTGSAAVESPSTPDAPAVRREKLPPGVSVRSQRIPPVKQAFTQKVSKFLQEMGLPARPTMPTETVVARWIELQKTIVGLLELRRLVEKQEQELKNKRQILERYRSSSAVPPSASGGSTR